MHQSRQRAVSIRHRSGDRPLHYKHNALMMFLLIGWAGRLARRPVSGCMALVLCTILNKEASWKTCRTNWFS